MSRRPDLPLIYLTTAEQALLLLDLLREGCTLRGGERDDWHALGRARALLAVEVERMRTEAARRADEHAQRWGAKP